MGKIDELINEAIKDVEFEIPIYSRDILGVSVFIYNKWGKAELTHIETRPYAPDGDVPLIFARLGFVEIAFNSHPLYNLMYKRKNGYMPEITKCNNTK